MTTTLRFLLLFLFPLALCAQTDSVAFGPGFQFKPGLYLNFAQFRQNKPVPRSMIVSNYDTTRLDYIRLVVSAKTITFRDSSGLLQEIKPSQLWGFSENNSIYIHWNGDFSKVIVVGSICHFTSLYTTYMTTGPTSGPGTNYGTPVENMQQYIIDVQTGLVTEYNLPNLESILKRDPQLFAEFEALRKAKRRKMMFYYLRKYNERNVVYFRN